MSTMFYVYMQCHVGQQNCMAKWLSGRLIVLADKELVLWDRS
jgi:hypothetical protein